MAQDAEPAHGSGIGRRQVEVRITPLHPDQRQRKIDIADLLTEPQIQQFQLDEMRRDNPVLDQLIALFHLTPSSSLPNS